MDFQVEKRGNERTLDMDNFFVSTKKRGNKFYIEVGVVVDKKPVKDKKANFRTKHNFETIINLTDYFSGLGFKELSTAVIHYDKSGSGFPLVFEYPAVFTLTGKVLKELKEASKAVLKEGKVARTPLTGFYGGAIYGANFKKRKGHVVFEAVEVYSSPTAIPKRAELWVVAKGSFSRKTAEEALKRFIADACIWNNVPFNDMIIEDVVAELLG